VELLIVEYRQQNICFRLNVVESRTFV